MSHTVLSWVDSFKNSWLMIARDINQYTNLNLKPISDQMNQKLSTEASPSLAILGNIHLLNLIFLPKYLYVFHLYIPV